MTMGKQSKGLIERSIKPLAVIAAFVGVFAFGAGVMLAISVATTDFTAIPTDSLIEVNAISTLTILALVNMMLGAKAASTGLSHLIGGENQ